MKLDIKNKSLSHVLASIKGVVPVRTSFPHQGMVLISPTKGGCYFYTNGPEAQIRYYTEDISIKQPVEKLISVSRIFDISRNFPEDSDISLTFKDNFAVVSCEGGQYKLNSLPPDEFPLAKESEKGEVVKLAEQDLKYLLEKTDFCMAHQDPRHYLNGLLFFLEDKKLSVVSTDGHRLALSSSPVSNEGKAEGILPRDIVAEVKRLSADRKDTAEISIRPDNITVSLKNIQISAKALNGQFPDYKKVIPKDFSTEIDLEREVFLRSLQRASAILTKASSEGGQNVTLCFAKKELAITSKNNEGEEASVKQITDYDGDKLEIAFNSEYLQDVMKTLDTEKICLQMRDANSGVRIVGTGSVSEEYIVMPLRI